MALPDRRLRAAPGDHDGPRVCGVKDDVEPWGQIADWRRELAPSGVAAVFDHVGGPGIVDSWRMLARGGTLISYGSAATRDVPGNPRAPVLKLLPRLVAWNVLPNGRRARFFNLWAGARKRDRYRADLRRDLADVLQLLQQGAIDAQIAKRFALRDAGKALRYAEQGALVGKVVLEP